MKKTKSKKPKVNTGEYYFAPNFEMTVYNQPQKKIVDQYLSCGL